MQLIRAGLSGLCQQVDETVAALSADTEQPWTFRAELGAPCGDVTRVAALPQARGDKTRKKNERWEARLRGHVEGISANEQDLLDVEALMMAAQGGAAAARPMLSAPRTARRSKK